MTVNDIVSAYRFQVTPHLPRRTTLLLLCKGLMPEIQEHHGRRSSQRLARLAFTSKCWVVE